ncbi:MAG: branched-chain amino acid ABC transporter permease [Firmicutes bacterium]|nr:branched-chain amino acid ABC transporter permease [Bacillota bacterium]
MRNSSNILTKHGNKLIPLVPVVILLLLPLLIHNQYYLHIFTLTFLWVALGSAWNIIGGFGGQLSIGHAAFFGIGAYTSSLLYIHFGLSPWLGMFAGGILAMIAALIISWPALRLRGPFFTLSTIAFAEVVRLLANHYRELTKGSIGLSIPFNPGFVNLAFRSRESYYYFLFAFMLLVIICCYLIQNSKLGYYLAAVREDEEAAESLGVPSTFSKLMAMLLSAFITAVAGTFYAQYLFYIDPHTVLPIDVSIQMVLIAAIGGLAIWQGPIFGGFIVTPLGEFLRAQLGGAFRGLHFVIFGVVLMLVVIFIPEGLYPWFTRIIGKRILVKFGAKNEVKTEEGGV